MAQTEAGGRREVLLGGALLLLLVLLAFFPVVVGRRSFLHFDLFYEHLPVWHAAQEALRAGRAPWWIDGYYLGQPLLFHQEAPLLYPLTAPLLLTGLPVHRANDLFTLLHVWLAGLGAFLLVRERTRSFFPALFGGTAWMLGARTVLSSVWPGAVAVAALLPFLALGLLRISGERWRDGILLAAGSGGLAILAARPQSLVGAAPLLLALVVFTFVRAQRKGAAFGALLVAFALALALGAPSLLPAARLYPEMSRAEGLSPAERQVGSLAASDLPRLFLPVAGHQLPEPETPSYPGAAALVLLLAGAFLLARVRPWEERGLFLTLLLAGLLGVLFAFGEAGPYRLVAHLPVLRSLRAPSRFLISWAFATAVGPALVLAALEKAGHPGPFVSRAAALLLAGELAFHASRSAPTAPSDVYRAEPELARYLRSLGPDEAGFSKRSWTFAGGLPFPSIPDAGKAALVVTGERLAQTLGLRFGLEVVQGGGPALRRVERLRLAATLQVAELAGVHRMVVPYDVPFLVKDPAAPGRLGVYVVPQPLPRAVALPEGIVVRTEEEAAAAVLDPAFDPRRAAVLESGAPFSFRGSWGGKSASVRLVRREPGQVDVEADLPGDGLLVLFDAFEEGWRATVDGRPAAVRPADPPVPAGPRPAGRHEVSFRYVPPSLRAGLLLGALGLFGLTLVALRTWR